MAPSCAKARKQQLKTTVSSHRACEPCRQWKVRCEGQRPQCSTCLNRKIRCEYTEPERRAHCAKRQIESLKAQIRDLQQQASRNGNITNQLSSPIYQERSNAVDITDRRSNVDGTSTLRAAALTTIEAVDISQGENLSQNDILPSHESLFVATGAADCRISDGITIQSDRSPEESEEAADIHMSSSLLFAQQLQASADTLPQSQETWSHAPAEDGKTFSNSHTTLPYHPRPQIKRALTEETAVAIYIQSKSLNLLPQVHVARFLFSQYLRLIHPITPYFIEEDIKQRFELTWTSETTLDECWIAQLNMIFALSCLFHDKHVHGDHPLGDPVEAGEQFYNRSWGYIVIHAFGDCHVSFLQLLLLAIQYQQGTNRGNQCWLTVGHAIRLALSLGLCKFACVRETGNHNQRSELYQRLWWGCYNLDRVSSLIYGKPMGMLSMRQGTCVLDVKSAFDDLYDLTQKQLSENTPSTFAFFFCTVRLYLLMDKIFETLRSVQTSLEQRDRNTTDPSFRITVLDLDSELLEWHSRLPEALRFSLDKVEDPRPDQPLWLQRQRCILTLRFIGMRVLLHRQSVLYLLQSARGNRFVPRSPPQWLPIYSEPDHTQGLGSLSENEPQTQKHRFNVASAVARMSADLCLASAKLQIETIKTMRPRGLTGAWWWDFHYTFNCLCILIGATSLQRFYLNEATTIQDQTGRYIAAGFSLIHSLTPVGGMQTAQSEKFLRSLHISITQGEAETSSRTQSSRCAPNSIGDDFQDLHSLANQTNTSYRNGIQDQLRSDTLDPFDPNSVYSEDSVAFGLDMMWNPFMVIDADENPHLDSNSWTSLLQQGTHL